MTSFCPMIGPTPLGLGAGSPLYPVERISIPFWRRSIVALDDLERSLDAMKVHDGPLFRFGFAFVRGTMGDASARVLDAYLHLDPLSPSV